MGAQGIAVQSCIREVNGINIQLALSGQGGQPLELLLQQSAVAQSGQKNDRAPDGINQPPHRKADAGGQTDRAVNCQ